MGGEGGGRGSSHRSGDGLSVVTGAMGEEGEGSGLIKERSRSLLIATCGLCFVGSCLTPVPQTSPPTTALADTTKHLIEIWELAGTRPREYDPISSLHTVTHSGIMRTNSIYITSVGLCVSVFNFYFNSIRDSWKPLVTMCEIWELGEVGECFKAEPER